MLVPPWPDASSAVFGQSMGRCRRLQERAAIRGQCRGTPDATADRGKEKRREHHHGEAAALALRARSREEERRAVSYGGGRDLCELDRDLRCCAAGLR